MDDDHNNLVQLSKVRAAKTNPHPASWRPVDALKEVVRLIENGEIAPDALVVCWRETIGPGNTCTSFRQAASDVHTAMGLLELTKFRMHLEAATK